MAEQSSKPAQPTESALALSFLREDIQNLRQDMRQIHERIGQTNGRIEVVVAFEIGGGLFGHPLPKFPKYRSPRWLKLYLLKSDHRLKLSWKQKP